MKLRAAEVVLIRMGFHQAQGSKIRPALVLVDVGDEDFVAAPITSFVVSVSAPAPIVRCYPNSSVAFSALSDGDSRRRKRVHDASNLVVSAGPGGLVARLSGLPFCTSRRTVR